MASQHSKVSERPSEAGEVSKKKRVHEPQIIPLMMFPLKEIVFKGPYTDVVTSPLSISNPTEKTIAFKMMVTAPKHYCCRPNIGYVRPGDTVEIQLMVEPMEDEKKIEQQKHKFMIQAMYVPNAPGDEKSQKSGDDGESQKEKDLPPATEFWGKEHSKKDIMFHKFTVAFHQQTMTKDKLDAILMDLTSRAAAEAAAEMERERRREEAERKEREKLLKKRILTPEERARLEVLLALQALALAKQKLTGILRIVPPEEVIFLGPFSEYACSTIRMTNPSDKHIYYKVLANNPKNYIIKPAVGILKPGETAITIVILEQQDVFANLEKEHFRTVENLVLRDKFFVSAAYANDAQTPIADFWKKREQGSVYAHKLKISLHLLNAEETKQERERRDKLKAGGYKSKDLVLSGVYGRDSGLANYYGKDSFGGPILPYPGDDGPNPYNIANQPLAGGPGTVPIAAGAGDRDVNNLNRNGGSGPEQRPMSAYGGGPLGGIGGSQRVMDVPAGERGQGGANNANNNNPQNFIYGPGGARGGSVMMGPMADGGKSGYAVPGNQYNYMVANNYGGAGGGGAAANNGYGGNNATGGGAADGSGNYGGAGAGNNAAAGSNGPAGTASQRPASAYGGGPLGGPGGSVRAMDYKGGAAGGSTGGAGSNNAPGSNGPTGSSNQRPGSVYGAGPLAGPGGSVRAMDYGGGGAGGFAGNSGGAATGGGSAGNNAAGSNGPAGSSNQRPASVYGAGPLAGPGGSVRAMDYGGGGAGGFAGNAGGAASGGNGGAGNNAAGGGGNFGGSYGPGGTAGGSVMMGPGATGTSSGYMAPGAYGNNYAGGSGGGQYGSGNSGGSAGGNNNNAGQQQQNGPQLCLNQGEKLKNVSMYMKN